MSIELTLLQELNSKGIKLILEGNDKITIRGKKDALTSELIASIKQNKTSLISLLKANQSTPVVTIPVVSRQEQLPLSFAQQRLWLLDKIDGPQAHFNMAFGLTLTGKLDLRALNLTFSTILDRHESLRTRFVEDKEGQPYQQIQPASDFNLVLDDLSSLDPDTLSLLIRQSVAEEANRTFDLSQDMMLRVRLLKTAPEQHTLLITLHHIASDGWSIGVFINEFIALYTSYCQGSSNPLPELGIQYADYAHWQRHWLQGEVLEKQLKYWEKQLAGLPVVHGLPIDRPRPSQQTTTGDAYSHRIPANLYHLLSTLCQSHGATLFMGLHAVFSVLISRYSNEKDIVIGTPIANREQPEIAGLIGFFANTLVLRSDLSDSPNFTTLLKQSKATLLDAYEHQQMPFEQIVARLQPERSTNYSPLFQIMLVFQTNETSELELPGLKLGQVERSGISSQFDLTLNATETSDDLILEWEFNCDLFDRSTIEHMAGSFTHLLNALLQAPEENVFSLNMLSEPERKQLLLEWNDTAGYYPKDKCIHELFEAQADSSPTKIALVFEGQQITYQQLNNRANQLAHYLVKVKRVKPDTLVGICFERSLEMVVAILGILKAGGAYVPLDPKYPKTRLAYMLSDAQLTTVITQPHLLEAIPLAEEQAICLTDAIIEQQLNRLSEDNLSSEQLGLASNHLAYVMYTSGSTGKPKGVMVEHKSVINLVLDMQSRYGLTRDEVVLQFASLSFDPSVEEMFSALCLGGKLVIRDSHWITSMEHFYQCCELAGITLLDLPTAFWHELAKSDVPFKLDCVRNVIVGGEKINVSAITSWFDNEARLPLLWNSYGPTESTVNATLGLINSVNQDSIGEPMQNTRLYVLNDSLELAAVNVPGELHIAGVGLARGYLNNPDLTQEKFIANPFYDEQGPDSSKRLYKTGDIVRWLANGTIEYVGRIDHQVKIRGFRIELDEIEDTLMASEGVNDAVVVVKESSSGDKRLVAYLVLAEAYREDAAEHLRRSLRTCLPDYMMPSAFVSLDKLPLTPNGKVDRQALPDPAVSDLQCSYIAPQTETEEILCQIWQEVLGVERVGINDNFFELGGHSLLATRLISRVNQTFDVSLSLKALFINATLADLAQALLNLEAQGQSSALVRASRQGALPLSYAQQRLWLLDQIDGGSAHYNIPGALKLSGVLNHEALDKAFTTIFERHESLRTCFIAGENGEPEQVIQPAAPFTVAMQDLSDLGEGACQFAITEAIADEANHIFDLSRDLMLRVKLLRVSLNEHILLVTIHHIASDGWSMAILVNEFSALYGAYVRGEDNPLPSLTIQYADYACWQRNWLQGAVLDKQLDYWQQQLSGLPETHQLPLDRQRPESQSFNGATYFSELDSKTSQAMMNLCRAQGATLFMGLHAAFSVLLSRYSNETDIVVGTPIANREQAEVADLMGFFVNTLVLRSDLSKNPSFNELLKQSKNMLLDAYAHQQVPFGQVVERLKPVRSLSHSPLFQIMLVLENNDEGVLDLPGLTLDAIEQNSCVAKYDLTLNVNESSQGLVMGWEYNTDLFDASRIENLAASFDILLKALLASPNMSVFEVNMLSDGERQQLLSEGNGRSLELSTELCIHQLFEQQVARTPNALAIEFASTQLTYLELEKRANQLAHYLIDFKGVTPGSFIGISVERSPEMVIGILAILKTGCAYVPIDVTYPADRIESMLIDSGLSLLLDRDSLQSKVNVAQHITVVPWGNQQLTAQIDGLPETPPVLSHSLSSQSPVYLVYTSGSTGKPKGIVVNHLGLLVRIQGWNEIFSFDTKPPIVLQMAGIGIDICFGDIVKALLNGGKLVICDKQTLLSPSELFHLIETHNISYGDFVPAVIRALTDYLQDSGQILTKIRTVAVGCEAWYGRDLRRLKSVLNPQAQCFNLYGQTESVIDVSYCQASNLVLADTDVVPIGLPLCNTALYVLNEHQQLQPRGVAGELCIGGRGLALSYINRDALTVEKFIADPFDNGEGGRLYRTGDQVVRSADGSLNFVGRVDEQVKIRGFRVELREIEECLQQLSEIKSALVLAKEDENRNKRLVGFLIAENAVDSELFPTVYRHLKEQLPRYMVPPECFIVDEFPLNATGKVDRNALLNGNVGRKLTGRLITAQTKLEKQLRLVWSQVLKNDHLGVEDNFFEVGGDSMKVVQLVCEAKKLSINFSVKEVFEHQTIRQLARYISDNQSKQQQSIPLHLLGKAEDYWNDTSTDLEDVYPVTAMQGMMLEKHAHSYPSAGLYTPQQMFYFIADSFAPEAFIECLTYLMKKHPILRTRFEMGKEGQYLQLVYKSLALPLLQIDLSNLTAEEQSEAIEQHNIKDLHTPFDLKARTPLMRYALFNLGQGHWKFLVTAHHAIDDGWGFVSFLNELFELYQQISQGQQPPAIAGVVNVFKERVALEREAAQSAKSKAFWQAHLQDFIPMTNILSLGKSAESEYLSQRLVINGDLLQQLSGVAKEHNIQFKSLFLFAYYKALSEVFHVQNVTVDIVTSGRTERLTDPLGALGLFWNFVPVNLTVDKTVCAEQLVSLHQLLNSVSEHALYPSDLIKESLGIMETSFASFNYVQFHHMSTQALNTDRVSQETQYASDRFHYPLNLLISANSELSAIDCEFGYHSAFLPKIKVKQIINQIEAVLADISNMATSAKSRDYKSEFDTELFSK